MADDDKEQKPRLKVVSDNPNIDKSRPIKFAKDEAERTLAVAAATMLRAIAGSDGAATALRNDMVRAILAEDEYQQLSGQWLASWDRKKVMELPTPEWKNESSDGWYREYERECAMQDIVQGALRLAAHQLLGERPHFGGKYSERLISQGMETIKRANEPPPPNRPKPLTKKQQAAEAARVAAQKELLADLGDAPTKNQRETPRKRWSPLDSKSYRDLEPRK
jgi:hypothetical protein